MERQDGSASPKERFQLAARDERQKHAQGQVWKKCVSPFIESLFFNRLSLLYNSSQFIWLFYDLEYDCLFVGLEKHLPYPIIHLLQAEELTFVEKETYRHKRRKTRKRWSLTATGDAIRKEGGVSWDKDSERIDGVSACYAVVRISLSKFILCFEPDPQRH